MVWLYADDILLCCDLLSAGTLCFQASLTALSNKVTLCSNPARAFPSEYRNKRLSHFQSAMLTESLEPWGDRCFLCSWSWFFFLKTSQHDEQRIFSGVVLIRILNLEKSPLMYISVLTSLMVTSVASLTGDSALVHTVRICLLAAVKCWVVCSDMLNCTFRVHFFFRCVSF